MIKLFLILCLMVFSLSQGSGQSAYAPLDKDYYQLIDRYAILEGKVNERFQTGWKPYRRNDIAAFVDALSRSLIKRNSVDQFNLSYLRDDNWEFSVKESRNSSGSLMGLYKKPSDFFHYRDDVFDIHINPVLYFRGGTGAGQGNFQFRNTRGVRLRGSIDRRIGFYTFLSTT